MTHTPNESQRLALWKPSDACEQRVLLTIPSSVRPSFLSFVKPVQELAGKNVRGGWSQSRPSLMGVESPLIIPVKM